MDNVQAYIQLLDIAVGIGGDLVAIIKGHAESNLTPEQYAQLQEAWDEDVARAKKNAGL